MTDPNDTARIYRTEQDVAVNQDPATTGDRATENRRSWWMPDPAGSALGLIAAILSVTPSLLPRPATLQGTLAGLAFAIGYLIGVMLWSAVRALLRKRLALNSLPRGWWYFYACAWVLAFAVLSGLAVMWQNEVRQLVSMPPLAGSDIAGFLIGFLPVAVPLVLVGKGVRSMFFRFRRRARSWLAVVLSAGVVAVVVVGLVFGAVSAVDRVFYDRNSLPAEEVTEPASEFRSAGSDSPVAWESLGRHGTAFVGGGPSAADIEALTGHEAVEPIRVYAGLESALTTRERAKLVVDELERTGAFEREVLVVATTTGSGWLESQTMDALEYLHGGNTAIAAMQYAYTPSWVSFVFDPDAPVEAARVLFESVEAKWKELPENDRPALVTYGLSLGAHGSQSVFTNLDDLRTRTDGALFVGSPNSSPLWRSLQSQRADDSPAWQPVLDEGREVRWMSREGDQYSLTGPWAKPRVLYLQHATDPVTWLSPELLWRAPEWLEPSQRSSDISSSMRWIPIVTGLQVTVDMLVGEAVPATYGHNYGDVVLTAWQQVTPNSGLDAEAISRIQSKIEGYSMIPKYEE